MVTQPGLITQETQRSNPASAISFIPINNIMNNLRSFIREALSRGLSISEIKRITTESELFSLNKEEEDDPYQVFIRNFEERIRERGAKYINEGVGRIVYAISPRFVIKISKSRSIYYTQNIQEINVYTSLPDDIKDLFPKIYAIDDDYRWIISDLVKPFNSTQQLNSFIGFRPNRASYNPMVLVYWIARNKAKNSNEAFDILVNHIQNQKIMRIDDLDALRKASEIFFWPIAKVILKMDVDDIHARNLGYTIDRKIVILDSGF